MAGARRGLGLSCAAIVFVLVLGMTAPAGAVVVTEANGLTYGTLPVGMPSKLSFGPMLYNGGPVVHKNATYAVYWDPYGGYSGEWMDIVNEFLKGVGSESGHLSNVEDVASQYTESEGPTVTGQVAYESTFRGAYTDVDQYPTTGRCAEAKPICLTDAMIRAELTAFIEANKLPTGLNPATGETPIYFIFTPPDVTVCLDGSGANEHCSGETKSGQVCSYHSYIPANAKTGLETILYATQPWTAGNYGTVKVVHVSGTECQDGTGTLQEPNQIGLGLNGQYNAGLADLIVNEVAADQLAVLTDPLFTGWHDKVGSEEAEDGDEIVDKCRGDFLGGLLTEQPPSNVNPKTEAGSSYNQLIDEHNYYINDAFDQAALYNPYPGVACINRVNLVPRFTTQNTVEPSDKVTFSASASAVDLGIEKYQWNFGDGESTEVNCGTRTPTQGHLPLECQPLVGIGNPNPVASVVHTYARDGLYDVKLTITDDGGNVASVIKPVTVGVPTEPETTPTPEPTPEATPTPTPTPTNTTPGASGSNSNGNGGSLTPQNQLVAPTPTLTPAPVLGASVTSKSLKKVLSGGLAVRYTTNEQVAGNIEVLLEESTAKRLGIKGATVTGLPKGTPSSIVVGSAVLVTTKAGQGTIHVKLSSHAAAHLKHTRKLKLILRLFARNASRQSPQTTTMLSVVVLNP
jgi:hypothetical protein